MAEFVRIAPESELPPEGEVREFTSSGHTLCVARLNGALRVVDGSCPHEGGPLGEGTIEGGRVVCPWHGYAFDLVTGVNPDAPELTTKIFEAKVEGGALLVNL